MTRSTRLALAALMVPLGLATPRLSAQVGNAAAPAADQGVPKDLRPLLTPHHSEMRLVTLRYTSDRSLLNGNYAGGGNGRGGGGGRGGPIGFPQDSAAVQSVAVSPAKISRLKRFDLSWQDALTRVDAGKLTTEARAERDSLRATISRNLATLDRDAFELLQAEAMIPFENKLVGLIEARLRLEDIDAERAARTLTEVRKQIVAVRDSMRSGSFIGRPGSGTVVTLRQAAATVDALRSNLSTWYNFYNGYDPLFTWWMGLPFKHIDSDLQSYAVFLRDSVTAPFRGPPAGVPQDQPTRASATASMPPTPAPKFSEVPDLNEILALPQDEMTDITARFLGRTGGRGGRGGGTTAAVRDSAYFLDWLTALKSIEFDKLSRNAQVDYLYLKKRSEVELSRVGKSVAANPPRKADNSGIAGVARGREGLLRDLEDELIPYTPEQLMVLAEREFAWCDAEMLKASRALGFGDNWKAALEKTKTMHVPPGGQPGMIRDLIFQAVDYLRLHDLVTVPEVDVESQRMSMMSPQAQLANPFFLGGSLIQVSYPTDGMEFDAQQQSMRGNNRPWSHATAFHEMIPGHNLSGYYNQRYSAYRANLAASGPFYTEGWAVYWELKFYDMGFDTTPEEKIGALFWRMHRCARIIFSLKFHMGQWSPQEAVQFLIDRVGHEPDNARAEVVRSFQGNYGPLYQAGYLLGAIQLRGLHHELVDSKQMTEKAFNDEILRQGNMPITLLKLALSKQKLTRDMPIDWKFYGELPEK